MKLSISFLFLLLSIIFAACSSTATKVPASEANSPGDGSESQVNSLERSDKQGAVTVTVVPANLNNAGETLAFEVSMQTHSVELGMDLTALSTLETDTGMTVQKSTWNGSSGGHHVKGTLSFPTSLEGKSILSDAKTLRLTIQNVDASERTFTWELEK